MKIVVPCDFTEVTEFALRYAARIAAVQDPTAEIHLLHVVEKGLLGQADEVEKLKGQLVQYVDLAKGIGQQLRVKGELQEGAITHTIQEYAEDARADLVVMGTHSIIGLERLFGSKAIKVVTRSNVPFLTVQKPPEDTPLFQHLVLPMGARPEEMTKLQWVVSTTAGFHTHVHVLAEYYPDKGLTNKLSSNLAFMKRLFDGQGIAYTVEQASKSGSFKVQLQEYAQKVGADLFMIVIYQSTTGIMPVLNTMDQEMIANSLNIPVLCLNPAMVVS